MNKKIIIVACYQCMFKGCELEDGKFKFHCTHSKQNGHKIENELKIPEWCPLVDDK